MAEKIEVWRTLDGTVFATKKECLTHEEHTNIVREVAGIDDRGLHLESMVEVLYAKYDMIKRSAEIELPKPMNLGKDSR